MAKEKNLEELIRSAEYLGNLPAVRAIAGGFKEGSDARTYYTDGGLTVRQHLDLEFAKIMLGARPGSPPCGLVERARKYTAALLLKWAEEPK